VARRCLLGGAKEVGARAVTGSSASCGGVGSTSAWRLGGSALVGNGGIPWRSLDDEREIGLRFSSQHRVCVALAWAEVAGAGPLVIGVNALDCSFTRTAG
jgi:hypothetical protein